jgi:hypothetical protein
MNKVYIIKLMSYLKKFNQISIVTIINNIIIKIIKIIKIKSVKLSYSKFKILPSNKTIH